MGNAFISNPFFILTGNFQVWYHEWLAAQVQARYIRTQIAHDKITLILFMGWMKKIQWVEKRRLVVSYFICTNRRTTHHMRKSFFEFGTWYLCGYIPEWFIITSTDNMFVGYQFLSSWNLRKGENKLLVRFRSPFRGSNASMGNQ